MIATLASLLAVIYAPTMWFMMALMFLLGVLSLTTPDKMRRVMSLFTQLGAARVIGIIMMLVGAEIFIWATRANMSVWIRVLGVVFFLVGGVSLVVPTITVILAEKILSMRDRSYRVMSILFLGLSVLFYIAQAVPVTQS